MDFRKYILALAGVAFGATAALAAGAPEHVDIAADNVTLHGTLYRPEGDGPFPAVVAMHDCGGLIRRPAMQTQLYNEWANLLVGKGFVVLFPDSFGSRGLGSQCREANRKIHARRERVADANAARRWLQTQGRLPPPSTKRWKSPGLSMVCSSSIGPCCCWGWWKDSRAARWPTFCPYRSGR